MELRSASLIVTEKCNFNCSYCNQKRGYTAPPLKSELLIPWLLKNFKEGSYINFYGGEPLLEFGYIRDIVEGLKDRGAGFRFSTTTNSSLMDDNMEMFLKEHFDSLMISYDGFKAQNLRKDGSANLIRNSVDSFVGDAKLSFSTNSVFTPQTVSNLYETVKELHSLGVKNIRTALDLTVKWEDSEIALYEELLIKAFRSSFKDSTSIYRTLKDRKPGYFQCSGAKDRLSIGVDGAVTGCFIFQDFVKNNPKYPGIDNYIIGNIGDEDLFKKLEASRVHYKRLSQYQYLSDKGFCMDCQLRDFCALCPITLFRSGGTLSSVPPWICKIKKVEYRLRKDILGGKFG